MTASSPKIIYSIIIPVRGSGKSLSFLLESIYNDKTLSRFEIWIINDGNVPEVNLLMDQPRKQYPELNAINTGHSEGSYHARNEGIKKARGAWLIFIDSDMRMDTDWFQNLIPCMEKSDYVAGNVLVNKPSGETLSQKFYRYTAFPVKDFLTRQKFGITGFLAVRRQVFNTTGYFNETIFSGGDLDLGRRVYNAKYRQHFCQNAVAWHSSKNLKEQFLTLLRINKGKQDLYRQDPANNKDLGITLKTLLSNFIRIPKSFFFFRRHSLYTEGQLNYFEFALMFSIHRTMLLLSMIIVILFPGKNWNT